MSTYEAGSLCEDCFSYGLQNYLKPFYINLDEQIIKCESSRCMFPYLKKPTSNTSMDLKSVCNSIPDSKPSDSILNLDEFIEQSAKQIDDASAKSKRERCVTKSEDVPIMFDFSSLFMDNPVKKEDVKNKSIILKTEDLKPTVSIKDETILQHGQPPPKARISRCFSNVKSSRELKKLNLKRSKSKRDKNSTVLVIEPQSGKSMRPLDLIMHYMKANNNTG